MSSVFYERGGALVKEAVAYDKARRYAQAQASYVKAVTVLLKGVKYDRNARSKTTVIERVRGYVSRAERLKAFEAERLALQHESQENVGWHLDVNPNAAWLYDRPPVIV